MFLITTPQTMKCTDTKYDITRLGSVSLTYIFITCDIGAFEINLITVINYRD